MDRLTWHGTELDGPAALELLAWQAEMGATEAMLDAPVDRFGLPGRADPTGLVPALPLESPPPEPAPVAAGAAPLRLDVPEDGLADALAQAERLAGGAATLEALAAAQESFDGMELKKGARRFCFADGRPAARVLVLGEAPGDEEDRQGRPFVGRAGQLLDRMFDAIGLSRRAVDAEHALYITNVLGWRPPGNRDPRPDEIALSLPFLRRHIDLAGPDVIVLMGNIACQAGLGRTGILRLRGCWAQAFGRPALPMAHPAYLLRNSAAKREAWADLLALRARLDGPS